jgi:23S rRNA pseudouridine2605 synthase
VKERIQKVLAAEGIASRRAIEEMVLQGRITVNGKTVRSLPVMIDPAEDRITIDGDPLKLAGGGKGGRGGGGQQKYYVLMNKPKGVYSTNVAQGVQTRAIDLLPPNFPARVYPVGQLDAESKGLLLLTNDGELTNQLTHPRYGVPKTYRAVIDGHIRPGELDQMQQGIWLADKHSGKGFKTGRARIKITKRLGERSVIEITLREGRNREVRRILAKFGHKVRDLTRIRMGPLDIERLPIGHIRMLTPREVKELKSRAKPESREPKKPRSIASDD